MSEEESQQTPSISEPEWYNDDSASPKQEKPSSSVDQSVGVHDLKAELSEVKGMLKEFKNQRKYDVISSKIDGFIKEKSAALMEELNKVPEYKNNEKFRKTVDIALNNYINSGKESAIKDNDIRFLDGLDNPKFIRALVGATRGEMAIPNLEENSPVKIDRENHEKPSVPTSGEKGYYPDSDYEFNQHDLEEMRRLNVSFDHSENYKLHKELEELKFGVPKSGLKGAENAQQG